MAIFAATFALADSETLGPGARIDALTIGRETFHHVVIRSLTPHTVVFLHDGGMRSVRLRDLSPDLQQRFHFDPAQEPAEVAPIAAAAAPVVARTARHDVRIDDVLERFGQPATLQEGIDLRPKFFQLELAVKNQGRRPSCAVFAVVSALEFQNAELLGKPEKFSEEYLIWATRRLTKKVPVPGAAGEAADEDADEGFTLFEVANALRTFGIPLQASMPDTFGKKMDAIEDPPPATVEEARTHQRVFVHPIPARDAPTCLNNIVHALNAGLPVAVGMAWPNFRSLRTGFLDQQKPQSGVGHAVTLVGYTSATGQLKDAVFIFKNSYGAQWGQGGYGTATYNFLANNLTQAVLLEVQGSSSR
ncbi:MAG TPA: C1 family peptidase [Candidatus Didemnitutus sp.]|nr:C1 family peptidase [Candidatus Didemnitutus sp.]